MIRLGCFLVAAIAAYGAGAFAQIRADVRPTMTPISSSSSTGFRLPGFYDSTGERSSFAPYPVSPGKPRGMRGEDDTTVGSGSMGARSIFFSVSPISLLTTRERYAWRVGHALFAGNAEHLRRLIRMVGATAVRWLPSRMRLQSRSEAEHRALVGTSDACFRRPRIAPRHPSLHRCTWFATTNFTPRRLPSISAWPVSRAPDTP